jgi:hypothetical protein
MDYSNLKKDELIQLLNEQKHLAEAIEEKDSQILRQDKEIRKLEAKLKDQEHLAKAIEAKDKEIIELKNSKAETISKTKAENDRIRTTLEYENQDLRDKLEKMPDIEKMIDYMKKLESDNTFVVSLLKQYMNAFKSYLKSQQGILDNTIELEALITEQLQNKNKGVN